MHRKDENHILLLLVGIFLLGCTKPMVTGRALEESEGIFFGRFGTNRTVGFFGEKMSLSFVHSSENRYVTFTVNKEGELVSDILPAGVWKWVSITIGDMEASMADDRRFVVIPGKITYIGDVHITVDKNINHADVVVQNNINESVIEFRRTFPLYADKYPLAVRLSSAGEPATQSLQSARDELRPDVAPASFLKVLEGKASKKIQTCKKRYGIGSLGVYLEVSPEGKVLIAKPLSTDKRLGLCVRAAFWGITFPKGPETVVFTHTL